uniref:Uncharacterized protein n=1 Tax=Ciona savignyi TaxID=51511 RepID=H2YHD9_CIOSA
HFQYTNNEPGMLRLIQRLKTFPLMISHWIGPVMTILQVYHPDSVHAVLTSGAPKNDLGYRFIRSWIGDGLLTSKGSKWFRNRRLLTPAFHYKVLKPYSEIFNKNSLVMVDKFKNLCGQSIEVHTHVGLMTLDTMLQCAMSANTNCQHVTFSKNERKSSRLPGYSSTKQDEVDTFLFEGHDTTASGRFYSVITDTFKYDPTNFRNDLPKLEYLTKFIKESMRLVPPVYAIGRQLEKPLNIKEKDSEHESTIPAGTNIGTSIFALHRHVHFWENPTVFDPERFTKENIAKRPAFAYVPFSAGSRNCIGQNFAMNEMKICLAQVIRNLRLYIDGDSPVPKMQPRLVLQSESGIFVKFEKL